MGFSPIYFFLFEKFNELLIIQTKENYFGHEKYKEKI